MSAERNARSEPPIRSWLRVVWLVGLVYAVASATRPGLNGAHLIALALTCTTAMGWGGWLASRHWRHDRISAGSVSVMAASGGMIAATLSPFGIVVIGVAGLCAASLFELRVAVALAAVGVVTAAIAYGVGINSPHASVITNTGSGAAAGVVIGLGRRQQDERTKQQLALALAHERTEIEHERAEVLAERNRIAREVHDVLAHTLSALSVQMEAVDSLVADGADETTLRQSVQRSRRLVVTGLEETRQAVRALRDEPVALLDQVAAITAESGASFSATGATRPLSATQGLALLRTAQEALTNARKHAPGAKVRVSLEFEPASVRLTVDNACTSEPATALGASGGGYGLRGMRERLELLGGAVVAGPVRGGWRVQAELPT
jgi:signal transduction histidine kinase